MFVTELFEAQERRVLVAYPGRFQPFHLGHLAVLKHLQAKFGADNVRITTSPNTVQDKIASGQKYDKKSLPKNPFNANEKIQLMKAAGVTDHQILLVNDPYGIDSVVNAAGIDPRSTVLIFAVGAPDKERLEVDSVYQEFTPTGRKAAIPPGKQVGDEKPFKTLPKNLADTVTVGEGHAYVLVVPEKKVPFTINGETLDISHGTECRAVWNQVRNDAKQRDAFLKALYGRATPELVHIFNKIQPDSGATAIAGTPPAKTPTKLPAPAEPAGGMEVKKSAKRANSLVKEAVLPTDAPQSQISNTPQAQAAAQALQKGLAKYQQLYPNTDHGFATGFIDHIAPDGTIVVAGDNSPQKIKALLAQGGGAQFRVVNQAQLQIAQQRPQIRTVQEMGGVGVVKGGNDPRYVMSTAGDQNAVTGDTLGKEMKALHLTGVKAPKTGQTQVKNTVGKGLKENDSFDSKLGQAKQNLLDMIDMRINSIQDMVKGDPEAERAYAPKLKELKQKKLEIIVGRKLGAM